MARFRIRLSDEQLAFRDKVSKDTRVYLSPLETILVYKLYQCLGRTVGTDALSEAIWPDDDGWDDKTLFEDRLKVHVCHLRKKLGRSVEILTFWGQGYSMIRLGKPTSKGE